MMESILVRSIPSMPALSDAEIISAEAEVVDVIVGADMGMGGTYYVLKGMGWIERELLTGLSPNHISTIT